MDGASEIGITSMWTSAIHILGLSLRPYGADTLSVVEPSVT